MGIKNFTKFIPPQHSLTDWKQIRDKLNIRSLVVDASTELNVCMKVTSNSDTSKDYLALVAENIAYRRNLGFRELWVFDCTVADLEQHPLKEKYARKARDKQLAINRKKYADSKIEFEAKTAERNKLLAALRADFKISNDLNENLSKYEVLKSDLKEHRTKVETKCAERMDLFKKDQVPQERIDKFNLKKKELLAKIDEKLTIAENDIETCKADIAVAQFKSDKRQLQIQRAELSLPQLAGETQKALRSMRLVTKKEYEIFIQNVLVPLGIPYIISPARIESEKLCAQLTTKTEFDAVLTRDTDAVAFGAEISLLGYKGVYRCYSKQYVFDQMKLKLDKEFDSAQLHKIFTLCCVSLGTDFSNKLPRAGPKTVVAKCLKAIEADKFDADQLAAAKYYCDELDLETVTIEWKNKELTGNDALFDESKIQVLADLKKNFNSDAGRWRK